MGKPLKQALWDLGAWLTMRILNQPLLLNQLTFGTRNLIKVGSQADQPHAPQPAQAAPVTQAARNFVDRSNETPAARRLREQQDKAAKSGRRSVRYNQMGAHNAINVRLPKHLQQVGSGENERSVLVLDSRDNDCSPLTRGGSWMRF